MTRKDIITAMQKRTSLTHAQSAVAYDALCAIIYEALARKERVGLTRVGTLVPHDTKARRARHPATGEMLLIPARTTIKFRPSGSLTSELS